MNVTTSLVGFSAVNKRKRERERALIEKFVIDLTIRGNNIIIVRRTSFIVKFTAIFIAKVTILW